MVCLVGKAIFPCLALKSINSYGNIVEKSLVVVGAQLTLGYRIL